MSLFDYYPCFTAIIYFYIYMLSDGERDVPMSAVTSVTNQQLQPIVQYSYKGGEGVGRIQEIER